MKREVCFINDMNKMYLSNHHPTNDRTRLCIHSFNIYIWRNVDRKWLEDVGINKEEYDEVIESAQSETFNAMGNTTTPCSLSGCLFGRL